MESELNRLLREQLRWTYRSTSRVFSHCTFCSLCTQPSRIHRSDESVFLLYSHTDCWFKCCCGCVHAVNYWILNLHWTERNELRHI